MMSDVSHKYLCKIYYISFLYISFQKSFKISVLNIALNIFFNIAFENTKIKIKFTKYH